MRYPPAPWQLRGRMYLSVWALPRGELPALPPELAGALRPVVLAGRGLVGAAWVEYQPGGVLAYRELLSAVLVRRGARASTSITDIWVDSVTSRDGGRELWGIPKDLASLRIGAGPDVAAEASADTPGADTPGADTPIAAARFRAGLPLPGRWPVRFTVSQSLAGRPEHTPVRARARLRVAVRGRWRVDERGPLAYLSGRRPLVTVALEDFRLIFGRPS